ncbi:MAG: SIR2 family protein [Gammaproteobacteria bacterium]|nr:SIR2 family protein [Gammaproteobacteria bacterium]
MQLVRNGPEVPERLLQAHEDGRVVFFCGAGISFPAGLPDFSGLVDQLYETLSVAPNDAQKAALKTRQFDTAIGLLEADHVGGRETVRRELAGILSPDLSAPTATATHEALLTLGRSREGSTRLITTNFDRLFEQVIAANKLTIERFQAPLLPVPKKRWDGLVYLHGLLSAAPTASELDRLVISSGDFGLAYLTERWAARFVSELFRNYTVCFVGYGINDPVLRYMMDALAADRLLGESPPEMFAFGSFSKGKEQARANEWQTKNVTPILYREHYNHAYFHRTLRTWAATYRDGVRGKELIVVKHGIARPLASTRQDDFVGRLLWAISDPSGLPAKSFADLDPVPSLEWLEPFGEDRYGYADLGRFGVPPGRNPDSKLAFSLTSRPAPYSRAPRMRIVDFGGGRSDWDTVMWQLAHWLVRHLDDPALLLWVVNGGAQLHDEFIRLIERRLDELAKLERDGDWAELARIRLSAPKSIPGPLMRTLWRLLLAGRMKSRGDLGLHGWLDRFKLDGLTAPLRLELRELLTPRISLRAPFRWPAEDGEVSEPKSIKDLVEWDIVLSADYVHSFLREPPEEEGWNSALQEMLLDFSELLRDALDLMRELGGAEDRSDLSYVHQPSISEHAQNTDFQDWTTLIDLTREAWLATVAKSPAQAALVAEIWWSTPYPLFRRLAFFAAAQGDALPLRRALDWLLADSHWWLWSVETEREATRLLVALAPRLDQAMLRELELAVLAGPPREMFTEDIDSERWTRIADRETWLRLVKMREAGAVLGSTGNERLTRLASDYPEWELATDQRDEFPFWIGDGDDRRKNVVLPRRRRELVEWLRQHPTPDYRQESEQWPKRCRDSFPTTACALCALVKEDVWLADRWRAALHAWSEGQHLKRSWRYMAPVLTGAPEDALQLLAHGVSWWLREVAESFEGHEAHFFTLARRILALDHGEDADDIGTDNPVTRAINHPVGIATEALLRWAYRRPLEDGQGLPEEVKATFTELCDARSDGFWYGRVVLAARAIPLFRVDQDWAMQSLLPLFDWHRSHAEARTAWRGFLWSPRLYAPLMEVLKPAFLDTASHYAELGGHDRQYAALLTFAALDRGEVFTVSELARATSSLPEDGLHNSAQALVSALKGAGDQRAEYWSNRVAPYLRDIWPKSRDRASPAVAERFGRLCVAAHDAFPQAFALLRDWLQPLEHPMRLVHQLHEAGVCKEFPEEALGFLNLVIGDETTWPPQDLATCLEAISTSEPNLATDQRYRRLTEYSRRHGL